MSVPISAKLIVPEAALRNSQNLVPVYPSEKVLMEPYYYLLQVPGKGMRKAMIHAFNRWFKIPAERAVAIGKIVQMLHTASLLVDDIEDNSRLRRGIPATHLVYGIPWTINSGNYVYFQAMAQCTKLGHPKAVEYFLEEMLKLHVGQGYDIYWRDCNTCPTEAEYMQMVMDKTGGLFRLAVKLMSCFSDENMDEYIHLVNLLGLFFQIRDDYINLQSSNYMVNKSFCEDLTEGKFSFPVIHCITSQPSDRRLLNILKQRTEDNDIKRYAVSFMEECGSFEYTRVKLNSILEEIRQEINRLGGNPELQHIVDELTDYDYHSKRDKEAKQSNDQQQQQQQPQQSKEESGASMSDSGEFKDALTGFKRPRVALTLSSEGIKALEAKDRREI